MEHHRNDRRLVRIGRCYAPPRRKLWFSEECTLEDGTIPYHKRTEAERLPSVTKDWFAFLIDIERKYWIGMYRYLKDELGVKAPISGTQLNYGSTHVQAALDYCDNHAYWNHPSWPVKSWDAVDWYVRNRALVNSPEEVFGPLATARVAGKPYTISEYNHPYPNQYSGEGLPMLAAFGRFQHWNGIFQYTYAHKVEMEPEKLTGYFDMDVHALQLVHSPACSAMFKRGLVKPASVGVNRNLAAEREIEILARTLSPRNLNYSGLESAGLPGFGTIDLFRTKTTLRMSENDTNNVRDRGIVRTSPPVRTDPPTSGSMQIVRGNPFVSQDSQILSVRSVEGAGYFTVNAPEVKIFTGFVREREFRFDDITMKPGKTVLDYATISLLSLEGGSLDGGGYLLTATGTMHNTNGEPKRREPANPWQPDDMVTLENRWGDAPVLCEGVPLELTLPAGVWWVYPLDEAGNRRADLPLRFENVPIRVGPEHKTLWYEIRPAQ